MPATGAPIHGKLCKLYVEADADIEEADWDEVPEIQGLSKTSSRNMAEIAERGEGEVLTLPSHMTNEVSIEVTRRPGAEGYDLLEEAYQTAAKIGVAVMNGDIETEGVRGYIAEMYVSGFDDDQGHEATTCSVTLRPAADYETAPAYVEVEEEETPP